jgi:hypothetical protein
VIVLHDHRQANLVFLLDIATIALVKFHV